MKTATSGGWRLATLLTAGAAAAGILIGIGASAAVPTVTPIAAVKQHFRLESTGPRFTPNRLDYASRTVISSPLLLFLPATGHQPADYRSFLFTARQLGYHVLALDYWNTGASVQRTCGAIPDCYTAMQRNRLDGSRPGLYSSVDPHNSIQSRLLAALAHLRRSDPDGGWQRFTTAKGEVDWRRVVVSGHSQGGGESAYIAHRHLVRGVLMFSSPVDSDEGAYASWMSSPGATPAAREFGFDDTGDVFYQRIVDSWNRMGLDHWGAASSTLGASHELITRERLGGPAVSHLRDITDQAPRTAKGGMLFVKQWRWMLKHFLDTAPSRQNA